MFKQVIDNIFAAVKNWFLNFIAICASLTWSFLKVNGNHGYWTSYSECKIEYNQLKQNQRSVIELYLKGQDVLFCSPTRSGKSI